ncbi:MAG: 4a-hydroxytetrahydrobiopterin dehydratase [Fimbriimonadaceae bacterium]
MTTLSYEKLGEGKVKEGLAGLPGWAVLDGMLVREFAFESYAAGLVFAVACGQVAEGLNHHPDLFVGYRRVRVSFVTHDAGGLTAYDFEAARRVSALA